MINFVNNYILIKLFGNRDLFDNNFYISSYGDVRRADIDPLKHFLTTGWLEGRNPSEQFDTVWYSNQYPDVRNYNINPLVHYIKYGRKEGRFRNYAELLQSIQAKNLSSASVSSSLEGMVKTAKLNALESTIKDNTDTPLVSILCRTYNHEFLVHKALDGFLGQQTNFAYEIIIGDDHSSDNTVDTVNEFQRNNPGFIKLIVSDQNIGPVRNLMQITQHIRGKYVAICDGDDYWTDPLKLQIQADFLEKNPNYALCFNKVAVLQSDFKRDSLFPNNISDTTTADDLINDNYIQSNSVMYRWIFEGGLNEDNFNSEAMPADWHLHLLHAKKGKIKFIDRVMGVYNKQSNGIWQDSKNDIKIHRKYGIKELNLFKTLDVFFDGRYSSILLKKIIYIYKLLATNYLYNEEYDSLLNLAKSHPDINDLVLKSFGINFANVEFSQENQLECLLKKQVLVSVVITSYNHESYIEKCIRSILSQRGAFSVEIVVGDDCSTDNTINIINSIQKDYPDVIRILPTKENIGIKRNMERCFRECKGDYIAICEGDDYWLSDKKISKCLEFLWLNADCAMCFNWLLLRRENGSFLPHPQQSKINVKALTFDQLAKKPIIGNFSCCFYRAEAIRSIPAAYYEVPEAYDWMFNLCVAQFGKIGFIKELLSVYRIHDKGLWSKVTATSIEARINASKRKLRSFFKADNWIEDKMGRRIPDNVVDSSVQFDDNCHINIEKYGCIGDRISLSGSLVIDSSDTVIDEIGLVFKKRDSERSSCGFFMAKVYNKDRFKTVNYDDTSHCNQIEFIFTGDIDLKSDCYFLGLIVLISERYYYINTNVSICRSLNNWILKGLDR